MTGGSEEFINGALNVMDFSIFSSFENIEYDKMQDSLWKNIYILIDYI